MREISMNLLHDESFVESQILSYQLDLEKKLLMIDFDLAYIDSGNEAEYLEKLRLEVCDWSFLKVVTEQGELCVVSEKENPGFIHEVLNFAFQDNELQLSGFGEDAWATWVFKDPTIKIYGELAIYEGWIDNEG